MAQAGKAAKPRRKPAPAGAASGGSRRIEDPVDVLLTLVATEGWRNVTLGRVAEASGMPLSALYDRYSSKGDMLVAYARRVDAAMLAAVDGSGASRPVAASPEATKDRLFEAVMARFDALASHKAAMRVLSRELPGDPVALAVFLRDGLRRGLDWTLAAADLDAGGVAGMMRRKLLGGIYLDTLRVWLKDDSPDLGTTMAHLDKRLGQCLRWLTASGPFSRMREKFTT